MLPDEMEEIYEESAESDQTVNTSGASLFKFRRQSAKMLGILNLNKALIENKSEKEHLINSEL